MYCGRQGATQREHVFPASWYPDTTPADFERMTVPSCGPCNRRWARAEEALLFNLALAISPDEPEAAGVSDRLLRSVNVSKASDPRDAAHRAARGQKLLRTMHWLPARPGQPEAVLRGPNGVIAKGTPVRQIEGRLWLEIAQKFIRGLYYAETGRVLPPDLEIGVSAGNRHLSHGADIPVDRRVAPGFRYGRLHTTAKSGWRFVLWDQVVLFAVTIPSCAPESEKLLSTTGK